MILKFNRLVLKWHCFKYYSSKTAEKTVKYTDTINLPRTKFPSRLSVAARNEVEANINKTKFASLYSYQLEHKTKPSFVLHDGPPYANGDLHMGHAVNKILKDFIIRQNIVNNKSVHYKAGWDCHGLPIELKALKGDSKASCNTIREKSRKFALQTIEKQKTEFESWGVTAAWHDPQNIYKTLNPEFIENQLKVFLKFFEKKLVFHDMKPVYWSPSSRTALAEAELEYDPNFESPSIILRMKMNRLPASIGEHSADNLFALIWTTTPWTLPANQAICYNSALEYSLCSIADDQSNVYLIATDLIDEFKSMTNLNVEIKNRITGDCLKDCTYVHPVDRTIELPFLAGDHVKDTKGTGLVHTAPAHGPDDFLIGLKNNIKIKSLVNDDGKYSHEAPEFLSNKHVLNEGNGLVMDVLKEDIIFSGKIIHSYPIDWRTKKPVIIKASEQWFMNTEAIKDRAIKEIEQIEFYPKMNADQNKRSLAAQVMKRPYWCISRQRVWGVPIPVLFHKHTKEVIINSQIISRLCDILREEQSIDFWWTRDLQDILSKDILDQINVDVNDLEKGKDIFDIWFDSGITWLSALDGDKIADLYVEGYDQFNGWFQSSLLTSVAFRERAPYKSLFVHGFAVDEKGHKMSKSLGNITSPKSIIGKYGTDTLRWWVASHGTQNSSIIVSDSLLKSAAENVSKVRATLRYLNGALGDLQRDSTTSQTNYKLSFLDKYILNELNKFADEIQVHYKAYEYNKVIAALQFFITNQLSATYLHLIKDRLYCGTMDESNQIKFVLKQCYEILCKSLWPIMPFTVEESWSYYDNTAFYENNISLPQNWLKCQEADDVINYVLEVRKNIYKHVKDVNTWTLECNIKCSSDEMQLLKKLHPVLGEPVNNSELCDILQLSSVNLSLSESGKLEFSLKQIESSLCPRCRRFALDKNNVLCSRCSAVLNT